MYLARVSELDQIQELKILNTIAIQLNGAVDLNKALKLTLQHTVELMDLQTGWIWLLYPGSNAVFLAASHQLPPAFTQHPERLSGWCYCIDKYLADNLNNVANISEIACTRLKDLKEGTNGLRYHATVPLFDKDQKIGLLNLVSTKNKQLTDRQLELLKTIGDLLSVTIVRARLFEQSKSVGATEERERLLKQIKQGLLSNMKQLVSKINAVPGEASTHQFDELKQFAQQLQSETQETVLDLTQHTSSNFPTKELQYPSTPLTKRELEVLEELKQGKTNKAIAGELFISERTVKFHVSTLFSKLDASNRTEAVQIAVTRGLIKL